jgi:phosphoribosylamine-glycine ligase
MAALETTLAALKMLENKRLKNQSIIIEEFIDGKMYTIDYYVDEEQNISLSQPISIKL